MELNNNRKTLYILVAVLGVVVIGGGIWLYKIMQPVSNITFDAASDAQVSRVYAIKDIASKNVIDFLGSRVSTSTILENIYNDKQYRSLKDFEVVIDLTEGIGNDEPFAPTSTSTDEQK